MPFVLEELDPRIHFALGTFSFFHRMNLLSDAFLFHLVCGAKSCPAIKTYQPDNVDDALDAAARAFFEGDGITIFNRGKFKEVKVSKVRSFPSHVPLAFKFLTLFFHTFNSSPPPPTT